MKHFHVFNIATLCGMAAAAGIAFAHEWQAPEEAVELRKPMPVGEGTVTTGETLYRQHCTSCHGDDMRGMTAEAVGLSTAAGEK
jgi:mono/diheme cytochrome c family protein